MACRSTAARWGGADALYAIVQMPPGVPVAAVAIGSAGAKNAGHLAARVLALADADLAERVAGLPQRAGGRGRDRDRPPRLKAPRRGGGKVGRVFLARLIDRYALPELRELFGERRRLQLWLRIELLAAEALHQTGVIPTDDWERLRTACGGRGR